MTHQVFNLPPQQPLSAAGRVLPGSKLYFYLTTTDTPTPVYTTEALSVAHSQPLIADAGGRFATVYLDPTITYKATVTSAADVLLYTVDPVNDQILSQGVIGGYLYPRTSAEVSASVTPTNYAFDTGDVRRYGADPTGVADSYTAIAAAISVATVSTRPIQITFTEGVYLHSQKINFSVPGLRVVGYGKVVLRLTTAGQDYAVAVDSGAASFSYDHTMRNLTIDANGNAQRALYCRNHVHRITENVRVRNATLAGFAIEGDVESTYKDCMQSDNEEAFSTVPQYGFLIVASAICSAVSTCVFDNVIVQCASVTGISCEEMDNCTFTNGASEGLVGGIGVYSGTAATGNVWHNFFCELNVAGGDLVENGKRNRYINCTMSSRAASPPYTDTRSIIVASTAEQCRFEGGRIYSGQIDSGAKSCVFYDYDCEYELVNNALATGCEVINTRELFISSAIQRGAERNTFTPIFGGSTTDGTVTHDVQIGSYVLKDGFCDGWLTVRIGSISVAQTGDIYVKGLPAAASSLNSSDYACAVGQFNNLTFPASRVQLVAEVMSNSRNIRLLCTASGLAASALQPAGLTTGSSITLYFRYPVA